MKIPLSLELPDLALHKRFTDRLVVLQNPFRTFIVIWSPISVTILVMGLIWNKRGEDISSIATSVNLAVIYSLITIVGLISVQKPKWTTNLFMLTRFIGTITLIYSQYAYLMCGDDVSKLPVMAALKRIKEISTYRRISQSQYFQNLFYIVAFSKNFFFEYILITMCFWAEMFYNNQLYDLDGEVSLGQIMF